MANIKDSHYYKEKALKQKQKIEELRKELPVYAEPFLNDRENIIENSTLIAYERDLITFFQFLIDKNPLLKNYSTRDIPESVIEQLTFEDINEYKRYLTYNSDLKHPHNNQSKGINRRMSALRSFFEFSCVNKVLRNNPTIGVSKRKEKKKDVIVRMNADEVNSFLRGVQNSEAHSEFAKKHRQNYHLRDTAIATLLLNTGIRISECVGLDVDHINFRENKFSIIRKGGFEDEIFFNSEVEIALREYLENERPKYVGDNSDNALFLSSQKKRMNAQSIRNVIKNYAELTVPGKKVTCHTLRRSFGTALYNETSDIKLVADELGHSDINTTGKFYAAQEEDNKRRASTTKLY